MNAYRLVALLAFLAGGQPLVAATSPERCRRAASEHIRWVHSGVWSGSRLVLGDVGVGGLAVFDLANSQWTKVSYPGEGPLEFTKHEVVAGSGPEVLVSTLMGRLIQLDEALKPRRGFALRHLDKTRHTTMTAVVEVSEGKFLAIVSDGLLSPSTRSDLWTGIAIITIDPAVQVERLRAFPSNFDEHGVTQTRASHLGAVLRGRPYWLALESEAFVMEIEAGTFRRLDLLPPEWRKIPAFPRAGGAATLRADSAVIQKLSFPAGLLAQGTELFILYREASPRGASWKLAAVDPGKPSTRRILTLPTRSPWLTVVPGQEYWAILEQGPILGPGTQTTSSVLLVPSGWFTALDSPLTRAGAEEACTTPP